MEEEIYRLVIPILQERQQDVIELLHRPDKIERNKKAVDFLSAGKKRFYLIEHTFIENQKGRKRNDVQFDELFGPLEKKFYRKFGLPGFYHQLYVEMAAIKGAKKTREIQAKLEAWILKVVKSLSPEQTLVETPEGVPFQVRLSKCSAESPQIEGRFLVGRISSGDESLKKMRLERIEEAFDKKFPKLDAAKKSMPSSRSVLMLESNDIALSNHFLIWDAVAAALKQYKGNVPDDIYLVKMEIESMPTVWILKEGEKLVPENDGRGPYYPSGAGG